MELQYDKAVNLDMFGRNLSQINLTLQPENFLEVGVSWVLPSSVEQKSLIKTIDFKNFCAGMVSAEKTDPDFEDGYFSRGLVADVNLL